jgi:hypothetical protein
MCLSAGLRPSGRHYLRFALRVVWAQIVLTEAILDLMSAARHHELALDLQGITLFEVCTIRGLALLWLPLSASPDVSKSLR